MSPSLSDYRRLSKLREGRQLHFLRAAIIGLAVGVIALLFKYTVDLGEAYRMQVLEQLRGWGVAGLAVFCACIALIGAVSAYLTVRFAPEATGSGIPHTKSVLLHLRTVNWKRVIPVKFIAGGLVIAAGFSLGREGPIVQLGAAIAAALAYALQIPRRAQAHLIACGAGAGLSAAFNAPLAGFIFVIEELRRELSPLTYATALLAAVMADVVTRFATGDSPSFSLPGVTAPPLQLLPMVLVCGLTAGLLGTAFNKILLVTVVQVPRLRPYLPRWARAGIIGCFVGLMGWYIPEVLGSGNLSIRPLLNGSFSELALQSLALLFAAKFILTILCYCSGVPGGIFAPVLMQGAIVGLVSLLLCKSLAPSIELYSQAFAAISMAAYFSAVVRAPLTAVILAVELTANYNLLFPLLIACLTSYLVSEQLGAKPLYEALMQINLRFRGPKEGYATEPILLDIVVEARSAMDGSKIKELDLPSGCLLVMLRKGGVETVPRGRTVLRAGDELTVVVDGNNPSAAGIVRAFAIAP